MSATNVSNSTGASTPMVTTAQTAPPFEELNTRSSPPLVCENGCTGETNAWEMCEACQANIVDNISVVPVVRSEDVDLTITTAPARVMSGGGSLVASTAATLMSTTSSDDANFGCSCKPTWNNCGEDGCKGKKTESSSAVESSFAGGSSSAVESSFAGGSSSASVSSLAEELPLVKTCKCQTTDKTCEKPLCDGWRLKKNGKQLVIVDRPRLNYNHEDRKMEPIVVEGKPVFDRVESFLLDPSTRECVIVGIEMVGKTKFARVKDIKPLKALYNTCLASLGEANYEDTLKALLSFPIDNMEQLYTVVDTCLTMFAYANKSPIHIIYARILIDLSGRSKDHATQWPVFEHHPDVSLLKLLLDKGMEMFVQRNTCVDMDLVKTSNLTDESDQAKKKYDQVINLIIFFGRLSVVAKNFQLAIVIINGLVGKEQVTELDGLSFLTVFRECGEMISRSPMNSIVARYRDKIQELQDDIFATDPRMKSLLKNLHEDSNPESPNWKGGVIGGSNSIMPVISESSKSPTRNSPSFKAGYGGGSRSPTISSETRPPRIGGNSASSSPSGGGAHSSSSSPSYGGGYGSRLSPLSAASVGGGGSAAAAACSGGGRF
jgi:hypothetical protein